MRNRVDVEKLEPRDIIVRAGVTHRDRVRVPVPEIKVKRVELVIPEGARRVFDGRP